MPLHVSSTCAHHQDVKIALHSLWYHQTYRCCARHEGMWRSGGVDPLTLNSALHGEERSALFSDRCILRGRATVHVKGENGWAHSLSVHDGGVGEKSLVPGLVQRLLGRLYPKIVTMPATLSLSASSFVGYLFTFPMRLFYCIILAWCLCNGA